MRGNVKGNPDWPSRNELPTFKLLKSSVPEDVLIQASDILDTHTGNDLGTDSYEISTTCPHPALLEKNYRQILIQQQVEGQVDEKSYTNWLKGSDPIKNYLEHEFGTVYRTRVTDTLPEGVIDWHIDTNTSVMCRIQICIEAAGSIFEFIRKGHIESFEMKRGEMWFINVGWSHRVTNHANQHRRVIIAGMEYPNLEPHFST